MLYLKSLRVDEKGTIHLPNRRAGALMTDIPVREAVGDKHSDSREFPSTDV